MLIVSYDIKDDKMRTRFSKMLQRHGGIRLQYSVYEVRNTNRIVTLMLGRIEAFSKHFTNDDSVVVFEADPEKTLKYGNAIHRDKPIVFF